MEPFKQIKIAVRSVKTHGVTRCKKALRENQRTALWCMILSHSADCPISTTQTHYSLLEYSAPLDW